MNRALVLSGGSTNGAFQAGALSTVLHNNIAPNQIYGVSVGALNGAFVADRAGRAIRNNEEPNWPDIGLELEEFWTKRIIGFEKIGRKRSELELARDALFSDFKSLLDMSKLDDIVDSEFEEENLRNSPVKFFAGVVNIMDGKYKDVSSNSPNLKEYIKASTRIPVVMPIQSIGESPYLDGGLRNVAPLKAAIDSGADKIITIINQAKEFSGASFKTGNLIQLSSRLTDIVVSEIVRNDIAWAEFINQFCPEDGSDVKEGPMKGYRRVQIVLIRPENEPDLNIETFNRQNIEDLFGAGKAAAKMSIKTS